MGLPASPAPAPLRKELFPCPAPFPEARAFDHAALGVCSRSVRSRLRSRLGRQEWGNSAVQTLNEVYGSRPGDPLPSALPSAAQAAALSGVRRAFDDLPKAACMDSAAAFDVMCGCSAGYGTPTPATRAKYRREKLSLPPPGITLARPSEHLRGEALDAWCRWRHVLLRSPVERNAEVARDGVPEPFTDPALKKRPTEYARFLAALVERGIVQVSAALLTCRLSSIAVNGVGRFRLLSF